MIFRPRSVESVEQVAPHLHAEAYSSIARDELLGIKTELTAYGFNLQPPQNITEPWRDALYYRTAASMRGTAVVLPKHSRVVMQQLGASPPYEGAPSPLTLTAVIPRRAGHIAIMATEATTSVYSHKDISQHVLAYLNGKEHTVNQAAVAEMAAAKRKEITDGRLNRARSLVTAAFLADLPRDANEYAAWLDALQRDSNTHVLEAASYVGLDDMRRETQRYVEGVFRNGAEGWRQKTAHTQACLDRIHTDHEQVLSDITAHGRFEQPVEAIDYGRPDY